MAEETQGGVAKKFLYVNRKAPYGTIYALESLEVVLHRLLVDHDRIAGIRKQGRSGGARQTLKLAIEWAPELVDAHSGRCCCDELLGRSIRDIEEAASRWLRCLRWLRRGGLLTRRLPARLRSRRLVRARACGGSLVHVDRARQ